MLWTERASAFKKRRELDDADIAAALKSGKSRQSVNAWLHGTREPNVSDFFDLCRSMGADPREILFGEYFVGAGQSEGAQATRDTKNPRHISPITTHIKIGGGSHGTEKKRGKR